MLFLFVAAAALVAPNNSDSPEITFSAQPEGEQTKTEVSIGYLDYRHEISHYWIRKTISRAGIIVKVQQTDTRSCPAGRNVLTELVQLDPIQPFVYGLNELGDISGTAGGVSYVLETTAAPPYDDGKMRISSNVGTPLARWIEAAFSKLSSCWRNGN